MLIHWHYSLRHWYFEHWHYFHWVSIAFLFHYINIELAIILTLMIFCHIIAITEILLHYFIISIFHLWIDIADIEISVSASLRLAFSARWVWVSLSFPSIDYWGIEAISHYIFFIRYLFRERNTGQPQPHSQRHFTSQITHSHCMPARIYMHNSWHWA
jgi:hypothetical protein